MELTYTVGQIEVDLQGRRFGESCSGLTFALGVTTGITMEFQFVSTNWADYSIMSADILFNPGRQRTKG